MTDICAPCDRYRRAESGRNRHIEDCCLNCALLNDQLPCPTLCERFYPSGPAPRPVEGGDPISELCPCTADCGDSADGRGGNA